MLNKTHNPDLLAWVDSANLEHADFPIQNLPFGVFCRHDDKSISTGVAIGDWILDLTRTAHCTGWDSETLAILKSIADGKLVNLMSGDPARSRQLRAALSSALTLGSPQQQELESCLVAQEAVDMLLPCAIGDYTDFYAGIHHARAVGKLFRPDQPLLPNYKSLPIAYHGRASSIQASGNVVKRPSGQIKGQQEYPAFGPTQKLDYELEVGAFIGAGNALGDSIPIADAERSLFGLVLLNDWSARDIQAWEYQPLGPFLAKNFSTTISPWIVTLEALAPFRTAHARPAGDPPLLDYLDAGFNRQLGGFDIALEVTIQSRLMREQGMQPQRLSHSNFKDSYWTMAQMLAHHTSNGCNVRAGDLFGSGTQSGMAAEEAGSLLELTANGVRSLTLSNGELRTFLEDGDRVALHGYCARPGFRRIGFGMCVGTVAGF